MPQVCEKYDIVPMTLMNIDSSDMTISDQKRIADTIDDNIGKYDGIVITHGTDTMAYTAAALSVMTENPPVPVVLTGSQRPFFDSGSDAPANFEDALAVAGGGTVCRVCVVFGGKIMDGRDCTKIDTVSDNAFTCVKGNIGTVKSGRVKITCNEPCVGKYRYDCSLCRADGKVAVLDMHPSFNPDMIKCCMRAVSGALSYAVTGQAEYPKSEDGARQSNSRGSKSDCGYSVPLRRG